MPLEDFQITGDLGKGSFGSVVRCTRRVNGQVYAMKQIKLQKLKDKDKNNALNQIRFLASIQSQYIVEYKQAFYDDVSQKLCIVMQYANQGDLQGKIKKAVAMKTRVIQSEIWSTAYQCLEGLSKLHESNIIHRDIKPANIFFHNGVAKIGDLNVAKHLKDPFTVTQTGTPYYASPQVWSQQPYNYKSDIWSLGCVLYQMAMHKPPFRADTPDKLYKKIMVGEYEKVAAPYTKELSSFINVLMTHNQKKRPDAKELLSFPKLQEMKHDIQDLNGQDESLLKTITFPKNLFNLNQQLPKAKYELDRSKSTKTIKMAEEYSPKGGLKLISSPSKKIPLELSTKNTELTQNNLTSQKCIGGTPVPKNMSIKELIAVRKAKMLNKCGSQKLIF